MTAQAHPHLRKEAVLQTLRAHWPELRELGVVHLDLVGSLASDEARVGSDVDLIVDFDPAPDLTGFFDLVERLEMLLGVHVDLMSRKGLRPHWRSHFEATAVRVA